MPAQRRIPSESQLAKWVKDGLSHNEICDRIEKETGYRPGRSTVSAALSRAGLTNRVRYDDVIPWKRISVDHNTHYALTMLRTAARIKHGLDVNPRDLSRFQAWKERLDEANAVVHYEYNSPEGFYYVPRRKGVDKGLIRELDKHLQSV